MAYSVNGCWTVLSNVGIGTDDLVTYHPGFMSPSLNIVGSRPGINLENNGGSLNTIRLKGTGPSGEMHLNFNGTSCTAGSLSFYTYGCANREVLTIGLNGNVGVGTGAPLPHNGNGLVVRGNGSDARGIIELHDGGASGGKSVLQQVGGDTYIGQLAKGTGAGNLHLLTGGAGNSATISMTILCAGNIGVGTTTPGARLDVCGADGRIQSRVDSSDGSTINVRPNAGKCGWISYTEDAVADRWGIGVKNGDAKLYFASGNVGSGGGTTRMVLDGSGSVGLGTTTPCTKLSVKCSTGSIKIDLLSLTTTDGAGSQPTMRFDTIEANCNVLGRISVCDIAPYAGAMIFETSGCKGTGSTTTTELMRLVGTTGNVGINTASPSYRLHVNGTFYSAGSSVDYKQSICQYNTDSCLFMCLKPVTYQYKDEYTHLGKELKSGIQIGLLAEDPADVFPELAIMVNEDDNKVVRNVDYEKLSIILLSEVQKLRKEVDNLKNNK